MRPILPIRLAALSFSFGLVIIGTLVLAQPRPPAMSSPGYEVWVTNQQKDSIQVIDGRTLKVVAEIPVDEDGNPATTKPHTIAFSPDGQYAYIANVGAKIGTRNIIVIHTGDRKVVATLPAGPATHMVLPSPDGSRAFAANAGGSSVTEIKTDTAKESFTLGQTLTIKGKDGGKARPTCLAFSSDGKKLYVTNAGDSKTDSSTAGFLLVLEVSTGRELSRITNLGSEACGLDRTQDGKKIYFTIGGGVNKFAVLDTTTDQIIKQIPTGSEDPHGLKIASGGHLVWITNRISGNLTVLNTTTAMHFKTYFKVGDKPDLLDFSPDGSRVFVTLRGKPATPLPQGAGGTEPGLLVLDAQSGKGLAKIPLGGDPHGIAVRVKESK
jgi:YVTN family beta-propeller protein